MNKIGLLFLMIVLAAASCTTRDKKVNKDDSDAVVTDSSFNDIMDSSLEVSNWVARNIIDWGFFLQKKDTFSLDSFHLAGVWVEDSMYTERYTPTKEFYDLYGPYLKFSQDSSSFVDLDSYNIILSRNKQGILEGYEGGPDNQIYLVDLEKKIRKRLMFNGPGTYIHEALWQDTETLILFGISEDSKYGRENPVVWKINVEENLFERYEYVRLTPVDNWEEYSKEVRFKGIKIR